MILFPNCKINLGLNVTSKRSDGYHNIETVFYPIPVNDVLEILKSEIFNFEMTGIPIPGSAKDNLCIKAYELLKKDFHLPEISMYLLKNIPAGSGLGGGSSDAAHTLLLLNNLFDLKLSQDKLAEYASQIGSDCPFFIYNKPMYATGKGEVLEEIELNLKGYKILLACPNISVSTPWAYSQITPSKPVNSLKDLIKHPIEHWKNEIKNDFEEPVFKQYPLIGKLKEKMYSSSATYTAMSGSGSSVYGLFKSGMDLTSLITSLQSQGIKCFETNL